VGNVVSNFSDFIGGGGGNYFKVSNTVEGDISSGTSGTFANFTAPTGKLLRVKVFVASSTEVGVTITIDGVNYITNGNIGDYVNSHQPASGGNARYFYCSPWGGVSHLNVGYSDIICTTFQAIKVSGSTAQTIWYKYDEGEFV
jgi:hypothetical protein